MYQGECEQVLQSSPFSRNKGKVQLLFTSPPFALTRKKKYGNQQGQAYVDWLAAFAPLFRDYLTDNGSIVIEIGNAWEPDQPTMSTLAIEALLEFKRRAELHLCQEFICFNPARLPSPAQWVNVKRCRVKDAFTRVWWLAATPYPKADNRRVLTEYSPSMRQLLSRGTYNPGLRPSEHSIGHTSFLADHGGAIPPNVLAPAFAETTRELFDSLVGEKNSLLPIANTRASDPYREYCRTSGLPVHPARMPAKLVEFFVAFLTEPQDLVLDPFAGSNTTGRIAETMKRRWLAVERDSHYIRGSAARFGKQDSCVTMG
ncbi:MAG: site-specific DNA-methyltransferase [Betaproteobacteria bacterium]|nr:site-specific DNA-methyltransferase [Betaproteobacteria bacterium]